MSPSLTIQADYKPVSDDINQYSDWEVKTSDFGMNGGDILQDSKPVHARVSHQHSHSRASGVAHSPVRQSTNPVHSDPTTNHHPDHSLGEESKNLPPHHAHGSTQSHLISVLQKEEKVVPKVPKQTDEKKKPHETISASQRREHDKTAHSNTDHVHRRFRFNETDFSELPNTKPLIDKEFTTFKPVRSRTTDVRLISLQNVCYCTQRNKFLVPRLSRDKKTKFPGYLYRYGAAMSVSWKRKTQILANPEQKVVQVDGTTIIWRGRSIHSYTNHLQTSLIPIRSLLDTLKKTKYNGNVKIAAESFTPSAGQEEVVRKAYNYFLGDVPEENRIELARLRPRLLCFERVLALGSEYEGHSKSVDSYEAVKDLIEKHESSALKGKLARTCKEVRNTKKTIWILERQEQHTHAGTVSNTAEVREAIKHELVKAHLEDKVNVQFIQSPSVPCPKGTKRAGCFASMCSREQDIKNGGEVEDCHHHPAILPEALAFNKMTFLITVSGRANEGVIYMPRGSQVIEVLPHGILDHSFESLAKDARLKHYRLENRPVKDTELLMFDRFGDVARNLHSCWGDLECRQFRRTRATHIDVHHLKLLLRKALVDWRKTCEL
ncbi:hypothetical protein FGB62_34g123 [Gracilaria domingensis]|nr:hypothetical protein FGB62_34g123 [Gracilaria domingensis]